MQPDSNVSADAFAAEAGVTPEVVTTVEGTPTVSERVSDKFYTEEDLSRVRSQEKSKLYSQIEGMKEKLSILEREREEKLAREAEERAKLEAELKAKREAEMDVRELLSAKERELEERLQKTAEELREELEAERLERQRAQALLDRERTFAEIQAYKQQVLEKHRDDIMPELLDLVSGDTPEEINASIAGLKERSSRILESAQQAMQSARRDMTGTRVTSPQTGPMDINTGTRQFTAEEISAMPLNEYAKYRQYLLSEKARGNTRGMLG